MPFRILAPLFVMLSGFLAAMFFAARGMDVELELANLKPLIMHLGIPVVLLNLGLKVPAGGMQQEWRPALTYTLVGGIISVTFSSVILSAIGTPSDLPLPAIILAASLLAVTDMSAVVETRKDLQATSSSRQRLEIESLALGALGGTVFTAFVIPDVAVSPVFWGAQLVSAITIALAGALVGGLLMWLFNQCAYRSTTSFKLLTFVATLLGLNAAVIHLNGSSMLFTAIFSLMARHFIDRPFWKPINLVAVFALLFISGATLTPELIHDRWLAVCIGAGLALLGRAFAMLPLYWLLHESKVQVLPDEPWLATFAAPRAAITLALTISVPLGFAGWDTLQAIIYGGVIASMAASATLTFLVHKKVTL